VDRGRVGDQTRAHDLREVHARAGSIRRSPATSMEARTSSSKS
jgi:hypothetical protein